MISPDNFTEMSLECIKAAAIYFPEMYFDMFPRAFNIACTTFDDFSTLHVLVFGLKICLVAHCEMLVSFAIEPTVRCPAVTEDTDPGATCRLSWVIVWQHPDYQLDKE